MKSPLINKAIRPLVNRQECLGVFIVPKVFHVFRLFLSEKLEQTEHVPAPTSIDIEEENMVMICYCYINIYTYIHIYIYI